MVKEDTKESIETHSQFLLSKYSNTSEKCQIIISSFVLLLFTAFLAFFF